MQKRPELCGVLGCHCCETAAPEHHRDILGLESVAWNPENKKNREEMVSAGTYRRLESSDGQTPLHLMGEEDRQKDSERLPHLVM